jgi:ketopantoate hydroxymethyltransferase
MIILKMLKKCKTNYKKNKVLDAIKIESNKKNYNIIKILSKKNISVMGHIG